MENEFEKIDRLMELYVRYVELIDMLFGISRPLNALGVDACLHMDKLKWNEAYPHKLVAAWMRILLATFLEWYPTSWLSLPVGSGNVRETPDMDLYDTFPKTLGML